MELLDKILYKGMTCILMAKQARIFNLNRYSPTPINNCEKLIEILISSHENSTLENFTLLLTTDSTLMPIIQNNLLNYVLHQILDMLFEHECKLFIQILYSVFTAHIKYVLHKSHVILPARNKLKVLNQNEKNLFKLFKSSKASPNKCGYYLFNLYLSYFSLFSDYCFVKTINRELIQKVSILNKELESFNEDNSASKICKNCLKLKKDSQKLKEHHNNLTAKYSAFQIEKEKMVMNFASSEKRLIESQRIVQLIEKKHQDAIKTNAMLQKKLQKSNDDILKLTKGINDKGLEITELRSQLEHCKDNNNVKEMKLKWTQNKLKLVTDASAEIQSKLDKSLIKISELNTEYRILRSQVANNTRNSEKCASIMLNEQRNDYDCSNVKREAGSSAVSEEKISNILFEKQNNTDAEKDITLQFNTLQKEYLNCKSKLDLSNSLLEKKNEELTSLKSQLLNLEILSKQLHSQEQHISIVQNEVKRLSYEKTELQSDLETLRLRENHILDFNQKLIDKNVYIQCEFTNMQSKYNYLKNKINPSDKGKSNLISKIKNLENDLVLEKLTSQQEITILTKYIAQQLFFNEELLHRLQDLDGENIILRRKYESIIKEINREFHQHVIKLDDKLSFINELSQNSVSNMPPSINKEYYNYFMFDVNNEMKKNNIILEKKELLSQIIKLQEINVRRAEKLDFMEEHSNALLLELQKKKRIIQNLSTFCDKYEKRTKK